ncbi:DUF1330 domain-containing protein [Pelagibius sp. Alg239-R121]|uniref:DUF1330 domain-containing protein n=1 Tax=Pelagibius sp. Alg239-R121 TaxID=2993448 RepID=UPI0024A76EBF|nr:DUF1330 domain-containing protein [Pelagibius sp. Alg239-R121]
MNANRNFEDRLGRLVAWYGDGADGSSPTQKQWRHIMSRPADGPVTLVNFFKLREQALYRDEAIAPNVPGSGKDAFDRYAAVSIPTMEKVGGRFLLVSPFEANFVGEVEDWDLVVVGAFPSTDVLLSLWEDADYHAVYPHRTAACDRQKVVVCGG